MKLKFLDKSERKYIFYSVVFFVIYYLIIIPWASVYFGANNPYIQFLWLNLGLVIFLQIFLKSVTTGKKLPTIKGFLGVLFLVLALSIVSPPMSVLKSGTLAVNDGQGAYLVPAASDFIVGLTYSNLGISGGITLPSFNLFGFQFVGGFFGFIYLCTYILTPIALLLASAKLLNDFVNAL